MYSDVHIKPAQKRNSMVQWMV